jgi:alpha-pyrone synthase
LTQSHINRIATAVPPHDVHNAFLNFAATLLKDDPRELAVFLRLAERADIDSRYSWLSPEAGPDAPGPGAASFYTQGSFPGTSARMRMFQTYAPLLAQAAIDKLNLGRESGRVSHLIVACCTGFSAPGLDFEIISRCGLSSSVERTMVGFMGCYAAINALKLARHIVRSDAGATVLVVNLELCTLHLQESRQLNDILSFMIFSDGCSAAIVSAEPTGFAMDEFRAVLAPDSAGLITWNIGDSGFEMGLSGRVPGAIRNVLRERTDEILDGAPLSSITHWAVHPGGRTILDAVESGLGLPPAALTTSRNILRRFGNMSSASVMFVLGTIARGAAQPGARGCAMSFGPGLVAEIMQFHVAG